MNWTNRVIEAVGLQRPAKKPLVLLLAGLACTQAEPPAGDRIQVESDALQETREILIRLPDGYADGSRRYPVLFVLDAEWVFPFAAGAVDFLSGEVGARIPEMIVVGIPNTNREEYMTWIPDGSPAFEAFMDFLEGELVPLIDSRYRTYPHRAIYGWSSASSVPIFMLLDRPDIFDAYIVSGSGVGPTGARYAREALAGADLSGKRLFASTEGTTPVRVEGLQRLVGVLEETAPQGLTWEWRIMDGASHASVLATGLYLGLETVYSDWALPLDVGIAGPEAVRDYYTRLGSDYGFAPGIPERPVAETAHGMLYGGHPETALELFEMNAAEHPESLTAQALLHEARQMVERGGAGP